MSLPKIEQRTLRQARRPCHLIERQIDAVGLPPAAPKFAGMFFRPEE